MASGTKRRSDWRHKQVVSILQSENPTSQLTKLFQPECCNASDAISESIVSQARHIMVLLLLDRLEWGNPKALEELDTALREARNKDARVVHALTLFPAGNRLIAAAEETKANMQAFGLVGESIVSSCDDIDEILGRVDDARSAWSPSTRQAKSLLSLLQTQSPSMTQHLLTQYGSRVKTTVDRIHQACVEGMTKLFEGLSAEDDLSKAHAFTNDLHGGDSFLELVSSYVALIKIDEWFPDHSNSPRSGDTHLQWCVELIASMSTLFSDNTNVELKSDEMEALGDSALDLRKLGILKRATCIPDELLGTKLCDSIASWRSSKLCVTIFENASATATSYAAPLCAKLKPAIDKVVETPLSLDSTSEHLEAAKELALDSDSMTALTSMSKLVEDCRLSKRLTLIEKLFACNRAFSECLHRWTSDSSRDGRAVSLDWAQDIRSLRKAVRELQSAIDVSKRSKDEDACLASVLDVIDAFAPCFDIAAKLQEAALQLEGTVLGQWSADLRQLCEKLKSFIPNHDAWSSFKDRIIGNEINEQMLLTNKHYPQIGATSTRVLDMLKHLKILNMDGCGAFLDTEFAKEAQECVAVASECVGCTFAVYSMRSVVDKASDSAGKAAAAKQLAQQLSSKGLRLPSSFENELKQYGVEFPASQARAKTK